jgi:hypothetical protein
MCPPEERKITDRYRMAPQRICITSSQVENDTHGRLGEWPLKQ